MNRRSGVAVLLVGAALVVGALSWLGPADDIPDEPRRTAAVTPFPTADTTSRPPRAPPEGPVLRTLPPGTTTITCVAPDDTVVGYIDIEPVDLSLPIMEPDKQCRRAFPGSLAEISGRG